VAAAAGQGRWADSSIRPPQRQQQQTNMHAAADPFTGFGEPAADVSSGTPGGDMDMTTPAPFAFPSAAGPPRIAPAAARAAAAAGRGVAGPSGAVGGALGFTPGVTPEAAAALNGTADGNAASGGNAAWRGTLMQLLGSEFAQQPSTAAGARFRAQPAAPGQHGGGLGSGFVTSGSDMDMMTPAAAAGGQGAVRGGLFDTPEEGGAAGGQQQQQQQGDESPSTPT
jgi:hypothetical protein